MLILTRRIGESIVIGSDGNIATTVLGVKGNQVRLGVEAPQDVVVDREEIYNRKQAEKAARVFEASHPNTTNQDGDND